MKEVSSAGRLSRSSQHGVHIARLENPSSELLVAAALPYHSRVSFLDRSSPGIGVCATPTTISTTTSRSPSLTPVESRVAEASSAQPMRSAASRCVVHRCVVGFICISDHDICLEARLGTRPRGAFACVIVDGNLLGQYDELRPKWYQNGTKASSASSNLPVLLCCHSSGYIIGLLADAQATQSILGRCLGCGCLLSEDFVFVWRAVVSSG